MSVPFLYLTCFDDGNHFAFNCFFHSYKGLCSFKLTWITFVLNIYQIIIYCHLPFFYSLVSLRYICNIDLYIPKLVYFLINVKLEKISFYFNFWPDALSVATNDLTGFEPLECGLHVQCSNLRVDQISDFEVDIRSCLLRKTICLLKLYISLSF